jgi:RNA polymerase sigma factor (sigma-70 family)
VTAGDGVESLLRDQAPQVLGALVRRFGHFDACEDAVQEALIAAAGQWPRQGIPASPRGWLLTVAARRLADQLRSEEARRRREESFARDELRRPAPPGPGDGDSADRDSAGWASAARDSIGWDSTDEASDAGAGDDTLTLLFLCCHPELTPPSQVALTLRAVAGLSTAEIARAFLVPEATMAQRISRAKQRITATGARFGPPPPAELPQRLAVVLHVLYLLFNEGYATTAGPAAVRPELTDEAIRLARVVHRSLPADGEAAGLLALMLLTEARRPARTLPDGALVPLAEQDRARWDHDLIREGTALVTAALAGAPLGPYQLQAAIAAVHAEAGQASQTDWRQILALYDLLERLTPSPVVTLNRAVAVAMVRGPAAGLDLLATLDGNDQLAAQHRLAAVRGHLLELAGDPGPAAAQYRQAARRATSGPERRYLLDRATRLTGQPG